MNINKILRALEKAACTAPKDAETAADEFMGAISSAKAEQGTPFEAAFYCAWPGDDKEEVLVRGWLQEARTLKTQCDELVALAQGTARPYNVWRKTQRLARQYRAELRKLAERMAARMEGDE